MRYTPPGSRPFRLKPIARLLRIALASVGAVAAIPALGADIQWEPVGTTWSNPASWTGGLPPTFGDTAVFGAGAGPSTADLMRTIDGLRFEAGSTINLIVLDSLNLENGIANLSGTRRSATVNGAAGLLRLNGGTIAGEMDIINAGGRVWFYNSSTAGTTVMQNNAGGTIQFRTAAQAGDATIANAATSTLEFFDASSAGNATINNAAGGNVYFFFDASAGTANITTEGLVFFSNDATADRATITVNNAADGVLAFNSAATAGAAQIQVLAGSANFGGASSAGTAQIRNEDRLLIGEDATGASATIANTGTGAMMVSGFATAGNATISNDGSLEFRDNASAGSAIIATGLGGTTTFFDNSSGGTARMILSAGGTLDISGHAVGTVSIGSLEGAGTVNVAGSGLLVGSLNTDTMFQGVIVGGGGALVKTGTGILILTGPNTYTAGTFIQGGTLQIGNGAGGSIQGDVVNDGTLVFNRAGVLDFTGTISGSGALEQRGAGPVVLWADHNYTGGTRIAAGSLLQLGAGGAAGSVVGDIANEGTLAFNRSDTVVFGRLISGSGRVVQGGNRLVLLGDNSYSGGTLIAGGVLEVGNGGTAGSLGSGDVTNDGVLAFNRSNTVTMAGAISGTGRLLQVGGGNLILTGASTYAGTTQVAAGTLTVDGSVTSAVRVDTGATLAGTGRTGGVEVTSGGTLSPGNSIGTLTVDGPLRFAPGSTYLVEADAAGNADRVDVTGAATIAGGTVDVQAAAGTYVRNTTYTIVSTGGGTTGAFDSVTSSLAFLTPTLRYEAGNVLLDLGNATASYESVAETPNQRSVATHLDTFAAAPGTLEAAALVRQIDSLDPAGARDAFDNLSGSAHAVASQVAGAVGRSFAATLGARTGFGATGTQSGAVRAAHYASMDAGRWEPALRMASDAAPQAGSPAAGGMGAPGVPTPGLWVQAVGGGGRTRGDGNGPSSDYDSRGLVLGYDQPVAPGWVAGAALGITRSDWEADTRGIANADGDVDSTQGGIYARYTAPGWRLHLDATYIRHDFDTERQVATGGPANAARSSHDGREWGLSAQVEMPRTWGSWEVAPLAGLRHARLSEDGFTESGASPGNLTVDGRDTQNTVLSAGVKFGRDFGTGAVELRAVASHLFGDADTPVTSRLAGEPGRFTVAGTPLRRNALTLGASVSGAFTRNVVGYLDAAYEMRGRGQSAYGLAAGVRVGW